MNALRSNTRFLDEKGDKHDIPTHHLVGEGGASTGIPLAVEPHGKLTTTWGRLKQ